jgi:uridine kinase
LPLFVGGPSGSGKTSLAQKMANIIGCEVISLESYYKPEQVRDYKYDEYSSLDIALLTKVMPFSLTKSTDQFVCCHLSVNCNLLCQKIELFKLIF